MKCFICNVDMNTFTFNRDHGDIDPCGTCKEVIANVFGDEGDDDELLDVAADIEPTVEELMATAEEEYYP